MKRRLLAIVFVFCLLFNLTFVAWAESSTVVKVLVEERIETNDTNGYVNNTNPDTSEKDKIIPFNNKDYYVFEVTVPETGFYTVGMRCGVHNTYPLKTQVSILNGSKYDVLLETQLKGTGGYTRVTNQDIGVIELSEGTHKIKFLNTYSDSYLAYITFTLIEPIKVSGVLANGAQVVNDGTVKRGSDTFEITFNQDFQADTVNGDTVYIMGNEKLNSNVSVDGSKVILALKETLEYGKTYTLVASGVVSERGTTNDEIVFTATEDTDDDGTATLDDASISISNGVVKAEGIMRGSHGYPIAGRKAYLYVTEPDSSESDVVCKESTTDKDGKYILEYALDENAKSGQYIISVGGEYIDKQNRKTGTAQFVSPKTEAEILTALKGAQDAESTEKVINDYAQELDLKPDSEGDLKGISDTSFVFSNLAGKEFDSAGAFRNTYFAEILTCKINEAETEDVVKSILSPVDNCVILGLNKEKIYVLDRAFADFARETFNLGAVENSYEMSNILSVLLDKALKTELGIDDVIFSVDDVEIFEGETAVFDLALESPVTEIKSADLTIASDLFTSSDAVYKNESVNFDFSKEENEAFLSLKEEVPLKSVESFGKIEVLNVKEGTKDITIKGTVTLVVNGFEILVAVNEKTVSVTAHPKKDGFVYGSDFAEVAEYTLNDRTAWNCKESVQVTGGVSHIGFHNGEWHEFSVDILSGGKYHFVLKAGVGSSSYSPKVTISGDNSGAGEFKTLTSGEMKYTGAWTTFKEHYIGSADLEEGSYKIRVNSTYADSYFAGLKLVSDVALGICDINVGETSLLMADKAKRGSDVINIKFNEKVTADTATNTTVKVLDGTQELNCSISAQDDVITVVLKESLQYDKDYQISVNGVKNIYGVSSVENKNFTFTTLKNTDDEGKASISSLNGKMVYETATLNGTVTGSVGQPVAKRDVYLYVKDTQGALSDIVANAVTDENGAFEIVYSIDENSPAGVYTFVIASDYVSVDDRAECALTYITRAQGKDILNELAKTEDADDVKTLLEAKEDILAIDTDADILNANIDDSEKFYAHLAGRDLENIPEFFDIYNKALVVEEVNQATAEENVSEVFADDDKLSLLGIAPERFALLTNREIIVEDGKTQKAGQKDVFIKNVYELDEIANIEDFIATVNDMFEESLASEYLKADSSFDLDNISVSSGYSAAVKLALSESVKDIEKIVIYAESNNEDFFDDVELSKIASGNISYEKTDKGVKITFTPERASRSISEIATLYLTPINETGVYELSLNGEVQYEAGDSGEFVNASISEKTIDITVSKKTSQGGGSSQGGTQTRVPTGATRPVVTPEVTPTPAPTSEPSDDNKPFQFTDIAEVKWAEESIKKLYDAGVVSKSDDGKFNPNRAVKREELVKMLVISLGVDLKGESALKDVSKDAWFYSYVSAAEYYGLVKGDDLGNFGVGRDITRQDLCVMIARALTNDEIPKAEDAVKFADDDLISDYAKDAVYWLKNNNMINGVGDNYFAPKDSVTRAMAAKLIASVLSYVESEVK